MLQQNLIQEIKALEKEALQAILERKQKKVIQLYKKVEGIFRKGDNSTKVIISNMFISPISHLLEMNYSWGKEYLQLFPKKLKAEYYRQIYSTGI